MEYRTCTYVRDDGRICKSAVKGQHLCLYHRRHRARLMRMAQYRARLLAKSSDSFAKKSEDASCKDAVPAFRSPKPSASIGHAPQPDSEGETPRALVARY